MIAKPILDRVERHERRTAVFVGMLFAASMLVSLALFALTGSRVDRVERVCEAALAANTSTATP